MGCDTSSTYTTTSARAFQSTHPHGVRRFASLFKSITKCFNPRTRMGCDLREDAASFDEDEVSIHAPAWGATSLRAQAVLNAMFQSTHPHGVRRKDKNFFHIKASFNPRTRMGCDGFGLSTRTKNMKFQSTHPHGVRLLLCELAKATGSFNPRTRMGCDQAVSQHSSEGQSFNPRTRMGCDLHNQILD